MVKGRYLRWGMYSPLGLRPEHLLLQSSISCSVGTQTFCLSCSPDYLFALFFTFIIQVILCRKKCNTNTLKFIWIHSEVIINNILANTYPDNLPINLFLNNIVQASPYVSKHIFILFLNGNSIQLIDVPKFIEWILYYWILNSYNLLVDLLWHDSLW